MSTRSWVQMGLLVFASLLGYRIIFGEPANIASLVFGMLFASAGFMFAAADKKEEVRSDG
jgi:hypothetical protein